MRCCWRYESASRAAGIGVDDRRRTPSILGYCVSRGIVEVRRIFTYSNAKAKSGILLAWGAVWKRRRCHCGVLEANGLAVYDLKHADDSRGDAVPKADLTLRVAIEGEEGIEDEWCTMDCLLRDATQVAEPH